MVVSDRPADGHGAIAANGAIAAGGAQSGTHVAGGAGSGTPAPLPAQLGQQQL